MFKGKNILIIAPHPDDEAICNGGLIMLAKKQKAKVFVLYGAVGTSRQLLTGSTSANERIPELKKAAKYGNFSWKIAFEGEPFMRLDSLPQKEIIEKIEDIIVSFKPHIVAIPARSSFDQDHQALAKACITALRPLPASLRHQPEIIVESEEPYTWGEQTFLPNFFIDISSVFDQKISLLKCHKTQLRKDPFPRSPENLQRLAGMRGCELGTRYAEAYNLLRQSIL